jgi:hypothetical protein
MITLEDFEGKKIVKIEKMKFKKFDDTGFLKFVFDDGTHFIIYSWFGGYTGKSFDEYPTRIGVVQEDKYDELTPI